ncbi:hypothetical protein [Streptomyces sp. NBC_00687]|uniref:hypothetical protein n=1 Tax=Streptomyces sp. NBC_00687 TaxID=2975807 RepID=UPI00224D0FEB|nr:hypothetical protein [Streptomyces sp. NBC_00687]MCX4912860.1 hypothetical protein [Streptomyces sp. NBC_00687]
MPRRPPPVAPPLPQVAFDADGRPVYAWPQQPAVAPQQPIVARPWGMYVAGGCGAVFAVAVLGAVAIAFMIGLAVVAVCLALAAVALTICVVILRDVWRKSRK